MPPPPRNLNGTGGQVAAVLPPSQSPRDEYDLAYGYLLRKDYSLAEDGFRTFLRMYPTDPHASDAQFWLGESLFQRQNYHDAADAFRTGVVGLPLISGGFSAGRLRRRIRGLV